MKYHLMNKSGDVHIYFDNKDDWNKGYVGLVTRYKEVKIEKQFKSLCITTNSLYKLVDIINTLNELK